VNFGDRDITEWDTTEGNLYGIKIGEIRPAPKLGYIRGWVTIQSGVLPDLGDRFSKIPSKSRNLIGLMQRIFMTLLLIRHCSKNQANS
jgi:hypothetical protein